MSDSTTEVRPVERTLRVHTSFEVPDLVGLGRGPEGTPLASGITAIQRLGSQRVRCVYYDTAQLRLIRWGLRLCRCSGGDDEGWQLAPDPGSDAAFDDVRMHLPLDSSPLGQVPEPLAQAVTALVRRHDLLPVATLEIDRTAYVLLGTGAAPVAHLVDDKVSTAETGTSTMAAFRELRISTGIEATHILDPMLTELCAHGATRAQSSTARHVLSLGATAAADVVEPAPVRPDDPAAAAVQAHLQTYVRRFLLQDVRVRLDRPDSVHQLRVAARRLRSGLRVFAPLVQRKWGRRLRDELGWAASELGLSRDAEVLLARLSAHAEELSAADARLIHDHLTPAMQAKVVAGRAAAMRALHSERQVELLEALVAAADDPRFTPEANTTALAVLPALFDTSFQKLATQVAELSLDGPCDPWHATRITAKRARYAADALAPVFGRPASDLASALSEVTDLLGEHQDACMAQQTTQELAEQFDGAIAAALQQLGRTELRYERAARLRLTEHWPLVRDLHAGTRWG